MNVLDLFSGKGGFAKAVGSLGGRVVAYCEKDQYARAVLLSRQARGELDVAPIWDDIRTLKGSLLPAVDVIEGGFPCQDISLAGHRKGLDGKRSGLFWEVVRLTEECSPSFVVLENVWPGVSKHVPTIRSAFEDLGFKCRDGNLAAADVGASHRRERWFLLAAHPDRIKSRIQPGGAEQDGWARSGHHST